MYALRRKEELEDEQWMLRKNKWKAVLLSIPTSFREIGGDSPDVWVQAWNRRQSVKQEHESMSRTAMQLTLEIDQFRVMVEQLPSVRSKLQPGQLMVEFAQLGLVSVQGGKKDDENEGKLTGNLISQALAVKKGILSSERAVEILLELEASYGTRSPFHQMSRLHLASTKPSTNHMRDWMLECVLDWLSHDLLQLGDISNSTFAGTKHTCGLIALFELKKKASLILNNCLSMLSLLTVNMHFLHLADRS